MSTVPNVTYSAPITDLLFGMRIQILSVHETTALPHSWQDAAKKLMDCAVVSRVDADEAANLKKAWHWYGTDLSQVALATGT